MKVILSLIVLFFIYLSGILLFTGGFLLRRTVLDSISPCPPQESSLKNQECGTAGRYKKAIIIIIDALRYDFLLFNDTDVVNQSAYQNKFKKVHNLLKESPDKTRLYRFIADPPTTTLQRLKGLTTGSLPTFVDAGSNFAKTEISEDNFIDQLRSYNKSIVFMGDDTWTGLYPSRFSKNFPYPSFNVKDLHTVDNGVIDHLIPELNDTKWDLIIAHLLGVDHCGHTFGPSHPLMGEKLAQMDDLIDLVTKHLDDETILFVMGDHGMTKTGDHGGDSIDEVESALFVYSPKPLGASENRNNEAVISQVDFVSSISLLLNLPIPFQNLGIAIADLFRYCESVDCGAGSLEVGMELNVLKALRLNALQVSTYIKAYANSSGTLGKNDFGNVENLFLDAEVEYANTLADLTKNGSSTNVERLVNLQSKYVEYLTTVRAVLCQKWAQFDMPDMLMGLVIFVAALLINLIFIVFEGFLLSCKSSFVIISYFVACFCLCCYGLESYLIIFGLFGIFLVLFIIFIKVFTGKESFPKISLKWNLTDISVMAVWLLYISSLLSNSFVVFEGAVTLFLLQSSLYIQFFLTIYENFKSLFSTGSKTSKKPTNDIKFLSKNFLLLFGLFLLLANFFLGFSRIFWICREEQAACDDSWLVPLQSSGIYSLKRNQLLLSILSILAVIFLTYRWLRRNGNMNGWSPVVVVGKYLVFLASLGVIAYWCLTTALVPGREDLGKMSLRAGQFVYLLFFISIGAVMIQPLCVFIVSCSTPSFEDSLTSIIQSNMLLGAADHNEIVPQIFSQLRANWRMNQPSSTEEKPKIYAYGLATMFSSPLLVFILTVSIVVMLLLDMALAPSVFLLFAVVFCFLEFHAIRVRMNVKRLVADVPLSSIITMLLLSSARFYSFGHHPTITSIRWEAAYRGFEGDFSSHFIPALLIGLNTFASQVLTTLALPLLFYWPLTRGLLRQKQDVKEKLGLPDNESERGESHSESVKGEFVLCEDDNENIVSRLSFKTIFLLGLKLFVVMVCVTIHRRHLMVWKIFAPRFIYEVVAFIIVMVLCIFNHILYLRTLKTANQLVSSLQ